ncbi:MAG: methyltransferase domain-containing protein [Gammaproteobacteria bacterium]
MTSKNKASSEHDTDFLAQEVGEHMLSRLDLMVLDPKKLLVLGGAKKPTVELLKKRYPTAQIIEEVQDEQEIVALSDHSVDFIFANLTLPWCHDLQKCFREWRRILRPEGLLMFSSLGPDTLIELRSQLADFTLVNLIDMHNIGDELMQARFVDPVLDVEYITVTYREPETMINELQIMDMLVAQLPDVLFEMDQNEVFSVTFEVVYGHAFGPKVEVDHVADEAGVVRIPLAHLRSQRKKDG